MTTPPGSPALRRYFRHGTLPQLAAFEATVRLGSASRAAQALCIAQPTISGHLRKLGEALDVCLFEIRGKRLVPTAAALALLEATHEVSAALARCERALATLRRDPAESASLPSPSRRA
jgi:LysR family transcriptional regulator for metE and metH